jgi:lysophospholipase L1-like esterase
MTHNKWITLTILITLVSIASCLFMGCGGVQASTSQTRAVAPVPPPTNTPPKYVFRMLAIGDSITEGGASYSPNAWRGYITWNSTIQKWVGSNGTAPLNHEGHHGWDIGMMLPYLTGWVQDANPDFVMFMAGTNDLAYDDVTPEIAADRLDSAIGLMLYAKPNLKVLVATIPEVDDSKSIRARSNARIDAFNALIPAIVLQYQQAGKQVRMVNVHDLAPLYPDGLYLDGLHPNALGYQRIAAVWQKEINMICLTP